MVESLSMTEKPLAGRRAVITGASRGLGRAIAIALAESGASLALLGRDAAQLGITEAEAKRHGVDAACFLGDVADETQVAKLEREVVAHLGGVEILINNAGMNLRKPLVEFSLKEWNLVLNTNLTSVFLLCKAFVPHMKGNGYGRIINVTSTMSHVAIPLRGPYAASKAGLLALSRTLALELAPERITVACISPGPFATELNQSLLKDPEVQKSFTSRIPLGRWGKPQEVGKLAAYLCTEDAGFITGSDILIDGGWCAQ
jgi:NAD(P)-dependent dehydrogenase (short-subunit alcohol dehydrogenase family)